MNHKEKQQSTNIEEYSRKELVGVLTAKRGFCTLIHFSGDEALIFIGQEKNQGFNIFC